MRSNMTCGDFLEPPRSAILRLLLASIVLSGFGALRAAEPPPRDLGSEIASGLTSDRSDQRLAVMVLLRELAESRLTGENRAYYAVNPNVYATDVARFAERDSDERVRKAALV